MKNKLFNALSEYFTQEASLYRYSLSYCFLLAIFPSLVVLVILFQNGVFDINQIMVFLYQYIPIDILEPFMEYIMNYNYQELTTALITIGITSILASRAFYTFLMISASHEGFVTYGILLRIKAIFIFLTFVGGALFSGIVLSFFDIEKYLTIVGVICLLLYLFYRVLSFEKRPWQYGLIGSVASTFIIFLIGLLYFMIINRFTSYNNIYGPIASVIIMLLSIHLVSCAIYFGYCLNHAFNYSKAIKTYKNAYLYAICSKYLDCVVLLFNKIKK